ncbi:hypothetical protein HanIR_Chr07g0337191 [Helianthus annuus]|nr:hypothetical protein HanIR_Chr07g0337191 [Helianthus annuus]
MIKLILRSESEILRLKNVLNIHPSAPSSATSSMLFKPFLTVPVVNTPLFAVRQHFIS